MRTTKDYNYDDEHGFTPKMSRLRAGSDVLEISTTAAFMMEGLLKASTRHPQMTAVLDSGYYELVYDMCQYAEIACDLFDAAYEKAGSAPGMYDYEVSPAFGDWFGQYVVDNADVPDRETCEAWLTKETDAFFRRGE